MTRLTELIALSAILLGSISGCARAPLTVNFKPLRVETIYFENMPPKQPTFKELGFEAYTVWFYHCVINLETEDVERDDTSGASSVLIKVKSVAMDLSCPIKLYISKTAPKETHDHEQGHIELCRKIYSLAPEAARVAASMVQGQTFYGMGANPQEARNNAINKAKNEVGESFRAAISEPCQDASEKYDRLAAKYEGKPDFTSALLSEMAYAEIINAKRTTIK